VQELTDNDDTVPFQCDMVEVYTLPVDRVLLQLLQLV